MDILLVSFSKFLLKLSFFELLTDECSKNSRNLWIDEKKKIIEKWVIVTK